MEKLIPITVVRRLLDRKPVLIAGATRKRHCDSKANGLEVLIGIDLGEVDEWNK